MTPFAGCLFGSESNKEPKNPETIDPGLLPTPALSLVLAGLTVTAPSGRDSVPASEFEVWPAGLAA